MADAEPVIVCADEMVAKRQKNKVESSFFISPSFVITVFVAQSVAAVSAT